MCRRHRRSHPQLIIRPPECIYIYRKSFATGLLPLRLHDREKEREKGNAFVSVRPTENERRREECEGHGRTQLDRLVTQLRVKERQATTAAAATSAHGSSKKRELLRLQRKRSTRRGRAKKIACEIVTGINDEDEREEEGTQSRVYSLL